MSKPKGPTHAAYFHLVDDGGWLTTAGLAMEVEYAGPEKNLERSLYRWRRGGYVLTRQIELAHSGVPQTKPTGGPWSRLMPGDLGRCESRREWRVA